MPSWRRTAVLVVLAGAAAASSRAPAQSIFTFAGGGSDDGRPAVQAGLAYPAGVGFDPQGNLVFAELQNHRVRRVDRASGVITTLAGTGARGFAGEGQPANGASLAYPAGVAFDASGNLYVADSGNNRIRKVDAATRVITTFAGTGEGGFGGDGGPAALAALSSPSQLAFGPDGDLYFTDTYNNRVRRVSTTAGVVTTVAGNGTAASTGDGGPATAASVNDPIGLAFDAEGNLFVAEEEGARVRRVARATGTITTVAGTGTQGYEGDGGPATQAQLQWPNALAVDGGGNLFVADFGNGRVRRVDRATGVITTIAGSGGSGYGGDGGPAVLALVNPVGLAFDREGALHIGDWENHRVRKIDAEGVITTVAGNGLFGYTGDGRPATAGGLREPYRMRFDPSGNLYLADAGNGRIRKVDGATRVITTVAGGANGSDGGPALGARLEFPVDVAFDAGGNAYIAEAYGPRIRRVEAGTGVIRTYAGGGDQTGDGVPATAARLESPWGIAVDSEGNLYVADPGTNLVRRVDASTRTIRTVAGTGEDDHTGDGGPATQARLSHPNGVALDAAGNLYVSCDRGRVRRIDPAGTITTFAGGGDTLGDGGPATAAYLDTPSDVWAGSDGSVYVSDYYGGRVRKVDPAGTITTVAGSDLQGFFGDGGRATEAGLTLPTAVAVTKRGDVFVSDSGANRVRVVPACVTVSAPALTSPAAGASGLSGAVTFSWGAASGAFRYDLRLDTANPPQRVVATNLSSTSFTASNLPPGTALFWSVEAKGDPFCTPVSTATSEVRTFTTSAGCTAPGAFELSSPSAGATGVSATPTLSWQPAAGAVTYDLYFGTSNPPPLAASGLTATSAAPAAATGAALASGTTYWWFVVAHASCDRTKTTPTPVRSFTVAGSCAPPGAFGLTAPADGGSTGTAPQLTWSASANAGSYDLYVGTDANPPLYVADLVGTSARLSGLTPGTTYRWRVVARSACDPAQDLSSPTRAFTVSSTCEAPGAPTILFAPLAVGVGQTYVLVWDEAPGLDDRGAYVVERSTSSSFGALIDRQLTRARHAAFAAASPGTIHHRVRAVAGCGSFPAGPPSATAAVTVTAGVPNVVFTLQPQAVVTELGQRLETVSTKFALENLGSAPVTAFLGKQEIASPPFFTIVDTDGGDVFGVVLQPRQPRSFEVRFSGPANDVAGAYQGFVVVGLQGAGMTATPYAFVNLKVGGGTSATPVFRVGGVSAEYAFFPGLPGDDGARPPLEVEVHNPGAGPMELAAEVGPEAWLVPEPGWNATPIPAEGSRTVKLYTKRGLAPNGSAYPRYTYLTVRTRTGQRARLLVQDNDRPPVVGGRGAPLPPGAVSYVVPSVVRATSLKGNTFVSRLKLSNSGNDPVQAELVFSPADADGYDPTRVSRATVVVPPNDVVALTDPLVQLFGLSPQVAGALEVRAPQEKVGFLSVTSQVDAPAKAGGGTFGFQMPTALRGEGARLGRPFVVSGITATAAYRTNLILVETSGRDQAVVRVSLYDKDGQRQGGIPVTVPRYGQKQVSGLPAQVGVSGPLDQARVELEVERGAGSVVGVVTVIDNSVDDSVTYVSQPVAGRLQPPGFREASLGKPAWSRSPQAATTLKLVVPAVVNGFKTFKDRPDLPYTFQSLMGFTSLTASPATFTLTYYDLQTGKTLKPPPVTVGGRQTKEYENVLEQLFGIGSKVPSQGPVFVEATTNGLVYAKVFSYTDEGTLGDSFPVVPVPSESLTGADSLVPLSLDGLEQSTDPTVGTRSNLILNEVLGQPASVVVRLYEAGNRTVPIAEKTVPLAPLQKVQLSTVFRELGLEEGDRLKDRANVQVTVTAVPGSAGLVCGVVTTIDNQTGDTKNSLLAPAGGVEATGGGTIGF
ncbi:MAG: hypothetical protein EDX89_03485 [Acidobacteria bacterium]|nr:MAG: hypothetical protein EDX89_03485 [Acidobacteriota bacterium]